MQYRSLILGYLLGMMLNGQFKEYRDMNITFENGVLYIHNAPAELINFLLEVK